MPEFDRPDSEEPDGLPVHQHPELMLAKRPAAQRVVYRFRCGLGAIAREDLSELSFWEIEALQIMSAARSRAELRALRAMSKRDEEEFGRDAA